MLFSIMEMLEEAVDFLITMGCERLNKNQFKFNSIRIGAYISSSGELNIEVVDDFKNKKA